MTTTFDKREQGFEQQFVHDEELRFKANARRNWLAGKWAAEKLGLVDNDAEVYAKTIVTFDLENPGSDSVFEKLRSDFENKGVAQTDEQIRRTLNEFMKLALAQMKAR